MTIFKRITIITMSVILTLTVGQFPVKEAAAEVVIKNPAITANAAAISDQTVVWDCLWFGSYPQTEIVDQAESCGTYGKDWGVSSDYEVSEITYNNLENASGWDGNGDLTLPDGTKYRRIKKADASLQGVSGTDYYNWSDSDSFHYFRYEPVKWRVLNTDGSTAFLLADIGLDAQQYHIKNESVTWETSTVRSWLNGYRTSKNFIDTAFTPAEQAIILTSDLTNADNIEFGTEGGNNTRDKIFLLSETEVCTDAAATYGFASMGGRYDEARRCKSSTYAKAMGTSTYHHLNQESIARNCIWMLRSPGENDNINRSAEVGYNGMVDADGVGVYQANRAVRPALRINLDSSNLYSYAGTVASTVMTNTSDEENTDNTKNTNDTAGTANATKPAVSAPIGSTQSVKQQKYLILSGNTVAFKQAKNAKSVTVPDVVRINGRSYTITQISAKAFKGSKIRTVTIGKNITNINKNAFAKSKTTKLIVKSKLLKKHTVKGSLKGSRIKTVQVKVGNKKTNKIFVKKYKKVFTKKNAGKKVKIK